MRAEVRDGCTSEVMPRTKASRPQSLHIQAHIWMRPISCSQEVSKQCYRFTWRHASCAGDEESKESRKGFESYTDTRLNTGSQMIDTHGLLGHSQGNLKLMSAVQHRQLQQEHWLDLFAKYNMQEMPMPYPRNPVHRGSNCSDSNSNQCRDEVAYAPVILCQSVGKHSADPSQCHTQKGGDNLQN